MKAAHTVEEIYRENPEVRRAVERASDPAQPLSDGDMRLLRAVAGPDPRLTKRERQCLRLYEHGLTRRDIAKHLVISEETVKTHLKHARWKTDATTTRAAAKRARQRKLL